MTAKIDINSLEGKVVGEIELPKEVFLAEVKPGLMALAIRVAMFNKRQTTSKVKSRGEVNKTGRKVWRQKGTGRARHGAKSAPIFVGGGVAFGPTGEQNYKLKINKKMKQAAILSVLSNRYKEKKIKIIRGLDDLAASSKALTNVLNNLSLANHKTLMILDKGYQNLLKAGRNLAKVQITQAVRVNILELSACEYILIHEPALAKLSTILGYNSNEKINKKNEEKK